MKGRTILHLDTHRGTPEEADPEAAKGCVVLLHCMLSTIAVLNCFKFQRDSYHLGRTKKNEAGLRDAGLLGL